MMFFQFCLLLGYLYAYFSSAWLRPRKQIFVHQVLLLRGLIFLPFVLQIPEFIDVNRFPILWQVMVMAISIAFPFVVLMESCAFSRRISSLDG